MIYRPENYSDCIAQKATIGVKFSKDIFLMRSFLDQHKIEYKEEDLDDGPLGKGIRIKRDDVHRDEKPEIEDKRETAFDTTDAI